MDGPWPASWQEAEQEDQSSATIAKDSAPVGFGTSRGPVVEPRHVLVEQPDGRALRAYAAVGREFAWYPPRVKTALLEVPSGRRVSVAENQGFERHGAAGQADRAR